MKSWKLTQKTLAEPGNDVYSEYGVIATGEDLEALRTRIDAALQIIKGELPDETEGVDYFGIIMSNTPLQMKVQELSRVLYKVGGVQEVLFREANIDRKNGIMSFSFTIKSMFGDIEVSKTFENI